MVARIAIAVAFGATACTVDASAQGIDAPHALAAHSPHPIVDVRLVVPPPPAHPVRCRVLAKLAGDSAEREVGMQTTEMHMTTVAGQPAVERVVTFSSPRGTVIDSTLTFVAGLAPISETSHQPTKLMRLSFDGAHVTGQVAPTDSAAHAIDQTIGVRVFNSSDIDLVVRSLPLAPGFRIVLPFYVYELGGLESDTVTVDGTSSITTPEGDRSAWITHIKSPVGTFTYWIDQETRDVLQMQLERGGAHPMTMRMVRI